MQNGVAKFISFVVIIFHLILLVAFAHFRPSCKITIAGNMLCSIAEVTSVALCSIVQG